MVKQCEAKQKKMHANHKKFIQYYIKKDQDKSEIAYKTIGQQTGSHTDCFHNNLELCRLDKKTKTYILQRQNPQQNDH